MDHFYNVIQDNYFITDFPESLIPVGICFCINYRAEYLIRVPIRTLWLIFKNKELKNREISGEAKGKKAIFV